MRIRVYLEHGHRIDVDCTDYKFTRDTVRGYYTSYKFDSAKNSFGFRPELIVGWERIR